MKLNQVMPLALAAVCATYSAQVNAGCTPQWRGSPHVDEYGGTNYRARTRAPNTWQDWIWRGGWEGERGFCPTNATSDCKYNWGRSKTTGTSTTHGLNISFSGEVGKANNHLWHGVATIGYNRQWTRYQESTQSFNYEVSHARGTFIEPIVVQNRRWTTGDMVGGWIYYEITLGGYCYYWDPGRVYGAWSANRADGSQYRTFHIYK
jgi:hypothetical protein